MGGSDSTGLPCHIELVPACQRYHKEVYCEASELAACAFCTEQSRDFEFTKPGRVSRWLVVTRRWRISRPQQVPSRTRSAVWSTKSGIREYFVANVFFCAPFLCYVSLTAANPILCSILWINVTGGLKPNCLHSRKAQHVGMVGEWLVFSNYCHPRLPLEKTCSQIIFTFYKSDFWCGGKNMVTSHLLDDWWWFDLIKLKYWIWNIMRLSRKLLVQMVHFVSGV